VRGDYTAEWFMENDNFKETFLAYHRIENYLYRDSELHYCGDAYSIQYAKGKLFIEENKNYTYELPQIMYVPAERSFLSSIDDPSKYKDILGPLVDFLSEYKKALRKLSAPRRLPINNATVEYDKAKDTVYIQGDDYRIKLFESASGFQSVVPLFLVSAFLGDSVKNARNNKGMSSAEKERFSKMTAEIMADVNMTDEQKRIVISEMSNKFNKSAFVNIIEEPEQNLFPLSQWNVFQDLLTINNASARNKLIITTHSPYLINYLTLIIKAGVLKSLNNSAALDSGLKDIGFCLTALIAPDSATIYELNERDGTINALDMPNGLPSDENRLNNELGETNELFAKILELQERI
jgi:hypothetical protein